MAAAVSLLEHPLILVIFFVVCQGEPQYTVESGLLTFVNHGCNGTFNIGLQTNFTELSIDLDHLPKFLSKYSNMAVYDPIEERRITMHQIAVMNHIPLNKGDELFDNYLVYGGTKYLDNNVRDLRDECSGAFGLVEQYQQYAGAAVDKEVEDDEDKDEDEDEVVLSATMTCAGDSGGDICQ
jgi:hypothetical protein